MFIPCILNNECSLYTNICTNKYCKFILKLFRHSRVNRNRTTHVRPPSPTHTHTHMHTHTHTHTHLTRNYICCHIYQYFIITTHYYISFRFPPCIMIVTLISQLMHSNVQNLEVKIYDV